MTTEVSWFSALCDDDYEFLGQPDPALLSTFDHCRNIVLTAPYVHSGKVWSLKAAMEIMAESRLGEGLTDQEADQIVAFLDSLAGDLPVIMASASPFWEMA